MLMKYTKRLSALVCAVLLTLCTSVAVFAEASYKLNDSADIFTSEQDTTIEEQLYEVSDLTGWDVIIYTNERGVDSYDMEEVCNYFYDISGFGKNDDLRGIMLTVDMGSREMYILTKGDTMYYFNDDRVDEILDDVTYYLSDDEYYEAAQAFIEDVEYYYNSGKPEGGSTDNIKIEENIFIYTLKHYGIIIGIVALAIAAFSVVSVHLRYKNQGKKGIYDLKGNSVVKLSDRQDIFLHKTVTVHTQSSSSSSRGGRSGGGGGRSSSHGGGGRSF